MLIWGLPLYWNHASMKTENVTIMGMTCAGCVGRVEKAIHTASGVKEAKVNFATKKATITGDVNIEEIITAIQAAGFDAAVPTDEPINDDSEQTLFLHRLKQSVVAGIVGIPLFIDMLHPWLPTASTAQRQWPLILTGIITFIVLWFSGRHIYASFWHSIKSLKGNMNTLVGMGTGVAWAYSMMVVSIPNFIPMLARHTYFDTAVLLLAFINLGSALEIRARGKTSQAIKRLIGLKPKTARVVAANGETLEKPLSDIQLGDILQLLPGAQVAVDGIVIEHETLIDESMLTGEPMPVHKRKDNKVFAGTVNQTGNILYQATGIGSDTALSRIITLVEQAQNTKPAVGRLVDKIASYFVPFVLCVAILTGIVWSLFGPEPKSAYLLTTVIAVLVIACPCALGLATPMSIMVGVGKAAEFGILIRGSDALQIANKLDTIVFDKTGTITQGKPRLIHIDSLTDNTHTVLQLAASLEAHSEHPLAHAILQYAENEDVSLLNVSQFNALSGFGVSGNIDGSRVVLGNLALMEKENVETHALQERYQSMVAEGKTVVFVSQDGDLKGLIAIADTIKNDARSVVAKLKKRNLNVIMLTGDNKAAAKSIAHDVGIHHVIADVLPNDKLNVITKLQAEGHCVAMVGDGINDAAALTQADMGIAMGDGTDVAIEAADIALMTDRLQGVEDAISISKSVMRNIKQNLFFAFVFNTIGIPIAAGVLYPFTGHLLSPVIAGAAMAMSSVTVVTNAGRLRFLKPI